MASFLVLDPDSVAMVCSCLEEAEGHGHTGLLEFHEVWVMKEYGMKESWTMLYAIGSINSLLIWKKNKDEESEMLWIGILFAPYIRIKSRDSKSRGLRNHFEFTKKEPN